jgi:hypothetical protein
MTCTTASSGPAAGTLVVANKTIRMIGKQIFIVTNSSLAKVQSQETV